MFRLQDSFLCAESHIGDSAIRCDCGSTNLVSLSAILNRKIEEVETAIESEMVKRYNLLPAMQRLYEVN